MEQVTIVIPTYKEELTKEEAYALKRCRVILKGYPIIFIAPEGLSIAQYQENDKIIYFDKQYFTGISGYNKLMLSDELYSKFLDYNFMLLYQLDAMVLKNELDFWCKKNYDYIGASWVYEPEPTFFKQIKKNWKTFLYCWEHSGKQNSEKGMDMNNFAFGNVGNGGFSLRKVSKMLTITQKYKEWIAEIVRNEIPEDIFWGRLLNLYKKGEIKVAPFKAGLNFAFDMRPTISYHKNNQKLPFGAHDFVDWDPDFWKNVIENILPLEN